MYWNYIGPQGFFYTTFLHQLPDTNTSIPLFDNETKETSYSSLRKSQIPNFFLNISEEDLLKAGYESRKTPWTEEEDQKLKFLRDERNMDWDDLSKLIPGRNSKMCYSRHRRLESSTKEAWKKKEDDLLIELVTLLGSDWKKIGKYFENRTNKQVKEHYVNYLRPEINREDWTLEEDIKLVGYLNEFGKNWKVIEERLLGRTQNQIKNRYFGRLKRLADKKNGSKDKNLIYLKNESFG